MNNKGQLIFFTFMLAVTLIVLALSLAFPVKQSVDNALNSDNLDCSNASISNFDKAACIVSDLTIFHFIGGLLFLAGAVLVARIVL